MSSLKLSENRSGRDKMNKMSMTHNEIKIRREKIMNKLLTEFFWSTNSIPAGDYDLEELSYMKEYSRQFNEASKLIIYYAKSQTNLSVMIRNKLFENDVIAIVLMLRELYKKGLSFSIQKKLHSYNGQDYTMYHIIFHNGKRHNKKVFHLKDLIPDNNF